jgi:hypothetical protein
MSGFRVESTRGELVESIHRVSAAVTDASGRLVASAGDPELVAEVDGDRVGDLADRAGSVEVSGGVDLLESALDLGEEFLVVHC